MRLRFKSWRIALAGLLLLGLAGGAFYWDWSSPTRRTQRLLEELEGREPSFFAKVLNKIGLARTDSSRQPEEIAKDLAAIGPAAVPTLLAAIEGNNRVVCGTSAVAIARLKARRAVPALVRITRGDANSALHLYAAVWALGEIGDPTAVRPILEAVAISPFLITSTERPDYPDFENEFDLAYPISRGLHVWQPWLVDRAVWRIGPPALPALIGCLDDSNSSLRSKAVETLSRLASSRRGVFGLPPSDLIALLLDRHAGVRSAVAKAVARQELHQAGAPLISLLRDPDAEVRASAADALGDLMEPNSVDVFLGMFRNPATELRYPMAKALAKIGGPKVFRFLESAVRDEDPNTRLTAVVTLMQMGQEATPLLRNALSDPEDLVREAAVLAVAVRRDSDAVPWVLEALKDPSPAVRNASLTSLSVVCYPADAGALEAIGGRLADESAEVRCGAASLLARIGGKESIPLLKRLLDDPSPTARDLAREAISQVETRIGLLGGCVVEVRDANTLEGGSRNSKETNSRRPCE